MALPSKIWDTIFNNGLGGLLGPWQKKRMGNVDIELERNRKIKLAQLEADLEAFRRGQKIIDESGNFVAIPANKRVLALSAPEAQEPDAAQAPPPSPKPKDVIELAIADSHARSLSRMVNLARIVGFAEEEAVNLADNEVSEEAVDQTWFARWRSGAEDVSTEELQRLWGKVLAGEVREPGRFSIHTLHFLSRMSKRDAELIEKVAQFAIGDMIVAIGNKYFESVGVEFIDFLDLEDLNILTGVGGLFSNTLHSLEKDSFIWSSYFPDNKVLLLRGEDPDTNLQLPTMRMTRMGMELISLGRFPINMDYLQEVAKIAKRHNINSSFGDYNNLENGRAVLVNEKKLLEDGDDSVSG